MIIQVFIARINHYFSPLDISYSVEEIRSYLNTWLPEDIGILSVQEMPPRFHSRLNATAKTYCYRISTDPSLHVFDRKYLYPFTESLDRDAMKRAASYLIGEHDFQSFSARKIKKSTVRRVDSIDFEEFPGELRITYHGNGFLYYMIRIMTGTLLEVGLGKRDADSIPALILARDRSQAGFTVPARGLTLVEVGYEPSPGSR